MPSSTSSELIKNITSIDNIRNAYFELAEEFEKSAKTSSYYGSDGIKINSLEHISEKIIKQVQKEIMEFKKTRLVLKREIPKKSGGKRIIFIYNIIDRIKAQAIYRQVEPVFEKEYAPELYSYRKSHPSYYAAKSVVRRYLRYHASDYVLLVDLKQYSDFIDYSILISKLKQLNFSSEVLKLLEIFISAPLFEKEEKKRSFGLIQGVPLIALFSNLYLTELDKKVAAQAELYRRVGDDLIVFDENKGKLLNIFEDIKEYIKKHKLVLHKDKSQLISAAEEFKYLGYRFSKGKIGLSKKTLNNLLSKWKKTFKYKSSSLNSKLRKIKYFYFRSANSMLTDYRQIIKIFPLINDWEQVKDITYQFYKLYAKFIFGTINKARINRTKKYLARTGIRSFFVLFKNQQEFYKK